MSCHEGPVETDNANLVVFADLCSVAPAGSNVDPAARRGGLWAELVGQLQLSNSAMMVIPMMVISLLDKMKTPFLRFTTNMHMTFREPVDSHDFCWPPEAHGARTWADEDCTMSAPSLEPRH